MGLRNIDVFSFSLGFHFAKITSSYMKIYFGGFNNEQ